MDTIDSLDSLYRFEEEKGSMWAWTLKRDDNDLKLKLSTDPLPKVACIECWIPSDSTAPTPLGLTTDERDEDQVVEWINQNNFPQDGKGSGFRLLVIKREDNRRILNLTFGTYKAILESFRLPPIEIHSGSRRQSACATFITEDKSYIFVSRSTMDRPGMTYLLRYNPSTNITYGYIIAHAISKLHDFQKCLKLIPAQFKACRHPLTIPVLLIELQTEAAMEALAYANQNMRPIEAITGYSNYDDLPEEREITKDAVRTLGEQHAYIMINRGLLLCSQLSLKSLNSILSFSGDVFQHVDEKYFVNIRNRMDYLQSSIEHGLIFDSLKSRIEAQQSAVFNIIAQKARDDSKELLNASKELMRLSEFDSSTLTKLAKASKKDTFALTKLAMASNRDSSALKIIAIMTTLFLPGTFVSTLFTMPLLDWQEASVTHVANEHFWIYWAITGPFTLVVALIIYWALFGQDKGGQNEEGPNDESHNEDGESDGGGHADGGNGDGGNGGEGNDDGDNRHENGETPSFRSVVSRRVAWFKTEIAGMPQKFGIRRRGAVQEAVTVRELEAGVIKS